MTSDSKCPKCASKLEDIEVLDFIQNAEEYPPDLDIKKLRRVQLCGECGFHIFTVEGCEGCGDCDETQKEGDFAWSCEGTGVANSDEPNTVH